MLPFEAALSGAAATGARLELALALLLLPFATLLPAVAASGLATGTMAAATGFVADELFYTA